MGATKHTPGPWEARTFLVRGGVRMSDTICHVGSSTSLPPSRSHESAANARLIAAGPDLLAALTALLDRYTELVNCGDCGNWDPEKEVDVIAARAALSKAAPDA